MSTKLIRFMDGWWCVWANIRMDDGDPCWISVAQTGVRAKKSKVGLGGAKLFDKSNIHKLAKMGQFLASKHPDDLTPDDMRNPVLKGLVNAVLHCSTVAEVTSVLKQAYETEQTD